MIGCTPYIDYYFITIYRRLEAKKNKSKKGKSEEDDLGFRGAEDIKFGDVVQGPPKLNAVPKVLILILWIRYLRQDYATCIDFSLLIYLFIPWLCYRNSRQLWMLHKKDFVYRQLMPIENVKDGLPGLVFSFLHLWQRRHLVNWATCMVIQFLICPLTNGQ